MGKFSCATLFCIKTARGVGWSWRGSGKGKGMMFLPRRSAGSSWGVECDLWKPELRCNFPGIRGCSGGEVSAEEGVRGQEWSKARIRAIFH